MRKKIIIEVDTTEDDDRIEQFIQGWVEINFQKYKDAKINIEEVK